MKSLVNGLFLLMSFLSVPEERFIFDVMRTRIMYFKSDENFALVNILASMPDIDESFKVPSLVLKRVAQDSRKVTRLS